MTNIDKAMAAAVAHPRHDRAKMNIAEWAKTCGCTMEEVRAAWERAMSKHSLQPQNSYAEGK